MVLFMFNNSKKPLLINIYGHLTSFIVSSVADDVIFLHVLCSEPTEKVAKKKSPKEKSPKNSHERQGTVKKKHEKKGDCKKSRKKKATVKKGVFFSPFP